MDNVYIFTTCNKKKTEKEGRKSPWILQPRLRVDKKVLWEVIEKRGVREGSDQKN